MEHGENADQLKPPGLITWEWYVFGDPRMTTVVYDFRVPLWRRIVTRILLGSKWIRRS